MNVARFTAFCPSDEEGRPTIVKDPEGEYVLWEDYKALTEKVRQLEDALSASLHGPAVGMSDAERRVLERVAKSQAAPVPREVPDRD